MTEKWQIVGSKWRFLLFGLLFIGLTGAGVYVVYRAFAGQSITFDWRLLDPVVVTSTLILLGIYFCSDGLRLYFTLRALGHKVSLPVMARLVFINLFFSNITPMATGGGFAQIWYLQKHGVPIGHATSATTIRTVLAILFIFTITPICFFVLEPLSSNQTFKPIAGSLIVLVVLYLAFFLLVIFKTRWLIYPTIKMLDSLKGLHLISEEHHQKWHFKIRREILRFGTSFSAYLSGKLKFVALSVGFTIIFLLSLFSFPAILIYALGYQVNYFLILGLLTVTTFVMYFSPTPGASGISEGVFGSFFKDIIGSNHLVLVIIAWRFITIYLGMFIGMILFQKDISAAGGEDEESS